MEKIKSFTVNHLKLNKGLYVSRIDEFNGCFVTTFDMRFTCPNKENVLDTGAIHTIEHLGATFWRNGDFKEKTVYFGPMGCRTGFYLILFGKYDSSDILQETKNMLKFIINYSGEIPGASAVECGNYSDQNLENAKTFCKNYLNSLEQERNLTYPD